MSARAGFRWCLACAAAATWRLLGRSTDLAEAALLAQALCGQALAVWGEATGDWAARQASHALFVGTVTAGAFHARQAGLLVALGCVFLAREVGKLATGVCLFEHDAPIRRRGKLDPEATIMHGLFLSGLAVVARRLAKICG
nr:hypothetical protein TetV2_00032 [Oceanusvirus sp.]